MGVEDWEDDSDWGESNQENQEMMLLGLHPQAPLEDIEDWQSTNWQFAHRDLNCPLKNCDICDGSLA